MPLFGDIKLASRVPSPGMKMFKNNTKNPVAGDIPTIAFSVMSIAHYVYSTLIFVVTLISSLVSLSQFNLFDVFLLRSSLL